MHINQNPAFLLLTRLVGMTGATSSLDHVADLSHHNLRHRFGYRMLEAGPLHRFAQIVGHDSLDPTKPYIHGTIQDLPYTVETIAWRELSGEVALYHNGETTL